ncbi:GNAT family N-acetyltransferase [Weissella muntiaci]|uniref:GNAT family N-acetyltransferase n=1 Tax=Weissella muntiaci TaxID=2508881 RepID=A0A6C2C665_9LACO|nr:GNAT family N-acetyltransferase [Weissella muntiaci]TYC49116.1 GNAT family N-acetyltransferase [Weissella muntiaci]
MSDNELIVSKEYGLGSFSKAALKIRQAVFVEEQGIALDIELDDYDNTTTHYVGFTAEKPVTTARVLTNPTDNSWHIQRVATLSEARGHGYAAKLMRTIIIDAKEAGVHKIDLGAQVPSLGFYERIGFNVIGEPFVEAGIDHVQMELVI